MLFSYVLYFPRARLWPALKGLAAWADDCEDSITVQFPDDRLTLPFCQILSPKKVLHHNAPRFDFELLLKFPIDLALRAYAVRRDGLTEQAAAALEEVTVGLIYLTVYADLSLRFETPVSDDVVLFDFAAIGTHMSLLFSESHSIRRTFVRFLAENGGLSGLFNPEVGQGELFWHRGRGYALEGVNPYMEPVQIDAFLKGEGLL